ncbi:MAG TPA: tRNA methyl transferase PRC-barrel domain-containing protein, partial [Burkholderiales bacterium]|nr:tRNA methyl transferase PRC-barrel domain-containing protein [Burkholderiales bacterium]
LFPVGEIEKSEVRRLAQSAGLPNFDRKDSTGICFIGERDFKSFLARYVPGQAGEIRTLDGEVKGRHDGVIYYTIGQRQGLGIGGAGEPWYVVGKDMARNILYVAQGEDHPALYSRGLIASTIHWIGEPPNSRRMSAKTRYRQADQTCTLVETGPQGAHVEFDVPQRAVTPGQSVVFYDGEECLGGGVIEQAISDQIQPLSAAAG